jgi:hypothetical protein
MRYKVKITVKAECEYEVEVEAGSESAAEASAVNVWRRELPEDFQVDKGYITDWQADDVEQLSWECRECGRQITRSESKSCDDMCSECYKKYDE